MGEGKQLTLDEGPSREIFDAWFCQEILGDWNPISSVADPSPVQQPLRLKALDDEDREVAKHRFSNFTDSLEDRFKVSHFWLRLLADLTALNDQWNVTKRHFLLGTSVAQVKLDKKTLDSVVLKAYRRNILSGFTAENPPINGWITPLNFLTTVRDILRTTFVVKFLDGGQSLVDLVQKVASETGVRELDIDYEARDSGYYAIHIVAMVPVDLAGDPPWKLEKVRLPFEIQICTQVQELIRNLTHTLYEKNRVLAKSNDKKWQWDPACDEFVPNYVAHTLHYCEGMIIRLKSNQESARK